MRLRVRLRLCQGRRDAANKNLYILLLYHCALLLWLLFDVAVIWENTSEFHSWLDLHILCSCKSYISWMREDFSNLHYVFKMHWFLFSVSMSVFFFVWSFFLLEILAGHSIWVSQSVPHRNICVAERTTQLKTKNLILVLFSCLVLCFLFIPWESEIFDVGVRLNFPSLNALQAEQRNGILSQRLVNITSSLIEYEFNWPCANDSFFLDHKDLFFLL